jgi:hypothetical protein
MARACCATLLLLPLLLRRRTSTAVLRVCLRQMAVRLACWLCVTHALVWLAAAAVGCVVRRGPKLVLNSQMLGPSPALTVTAARRAAKCAGLQKTPVWSEDMAKKFCRHQLPDRLPPPTQHTPPQNGVPDQLRRRPAARARCRARPPHGARPSGTQGPVQTVFTAPRRDATRRAAPAARALTRIAAPRAQAVVCSAAAPKPFEAARLAVAGFSAALLLSAAPAQATNLCASNPTCACPSRWPARRGAARRGAPSRARRASSPCDTRRILRSPLTR